MFGLGSPLRILFLVGIAALAIVAARQAVKFVNKPEYLVN